MEAAIATARVRHMFETFDAGWLDRLGEVYAPTFEFVDVFRTIHADMPALRAHFAGMTRLATSRFAVEDAAHGQDGSYLRWTWSWQRRARDQVRHVPGITHLRFAADGRVAYHRDIFDAAAGIYEAVPVLGAALRAVKRRI